MSVNSPRIFTLPGWQGSGPEHWQSRWEAAFGDERVEQHDWMQPLRGDWITRLEDVVQNHIAQQQKEGQGQTVRPIVFAAHSLGCHLVAAWAALSSNLSHAAGALLVAPPSADAISCAPQMHSWSKPVLAKLPFKTMLVASTRDPFCKFLMAEELAAHWGSELINAGPIGHINADSGLGAWPAGRDLLTQTYA